jgi:ABC-type Zn uptake system ZnuABC Zn-binding protein ZnuA
VSLLAAFVFALTACGGSGGSGGGGQQGDSGDEPLRVVATYSILGDLVENVGGEEVEVTTLVGPDSDAHTFEPSPRDSAELTEAAVIFENGLEFETWLDELYESSGSDAERVVVTEGIEPLPAAEGEHGHEHSEEGHDHGSEEGGHSHEHGGEAGADEEASARLLVADGEEARVHVVDTGSGERLDTYELDAPAYVNTTHGGRYGFAVQPEGDRTDVIDGGVWVEDHGDHSHVHAEEPRMLDFSLTGDEPVHFVSHEGQVAIFYDGDGTATVFEEEGLEDGSAEQTTIETGTPHHGVAVPMGDRVIASQAAREEEGDLPSTLAIYDLDGNKLEEFSGCGGMHGEVSFGESAAFACEDGVMVLERQGDRFVKKEISYPEGTTEENRSWTLLGDEEVPYLVGDSGEDGLMRVDLESGEMERLALPDEVADFALDPETGHALVLTTDGRLRTIDPSSGQAEASVEAIEPFALPEEFGPPVPSIEVGHGVAYVSEPKTGEVVEVHLEDMAVEDTFDVGGKPTGVAVLGAGAGEHGHEHAEENQEEHEHGEEHAHEHGEFDPHVWQDPNNAVVMVEAIRDALVEADPENADTYRQNAEAYLGELEELDAEVTEQVEAIPEENRVLFTTHDTFGYFAQRYGFEVDTALASVSTEASDPSAGEIAELVEEIRASGVPAVFAENVSNPDLMQRIADEAGVELAPPLYTDALGEEGSEGDTYVKMVRYNASTISEALAG